MHSFAALPHAAQFMTETTISRPLLRRPWFVALLVCGVAASCVALAILFMVKNMGALMASQPIRIPVDAQAQYQISMKQLTAATDDYSRWVALGRASLWSVDVGRYDDANAFARELEALLVKYPTDWNYGNAVSQVHTTLGRLALKRGDFELAKRELALAGTSPGSPQMDTFGPNLTLARDLLASGDPGARAAVLAHFDAIEKFWRMDRSALRVWREDVRAGREPNFGTALLR